MFTEWPFRRSLIVLTFFAASSAVAGGVELLSSYQGSPFFPIEMLRPTPFTDFLIPGAILLSVGLANLISGVLLWQMSRFALDTTLFAGGMLLFWIIGEFALLRQVHWLQGVYGVVGGATLVLAMWATRQGAQMRHRWIITVTSAEALGFMAPLVAGVFVQHQSFSEPMQMLIVSTAGLIEGFLLGWGQAAAFPLKLKKLRYASLSAAAAAFAWASIMLAMQHAPITALIVAPMALVAMGGAQWFELRRVVARPARWIGWTALAWLVALPLSFTPSPLVDAQTPPWVNLLLWMCAGVMMAYTMALITWQGVRRLVPTLSS